MAETKHSQWGASKFERIMLCPGSVVAQAGGGRGVSVYAAEGTAAHQVLTWALREERPATEYLGRVIEADGFTFTVDEDMAGHVQVCVDYVLAARGDDGVVLVDQRVEYSGLLGLDPGRAWGTLDVAVLRAMPDGAQELVVLDFKYGRGVEVVAEDNPQLMLYALGAFEDLAFLLDDVEKVRLVISQPRLTPKPTEWETTKTALRAWAKEHGRKAVETAQLALLEHGEIPAQAWAKAYLKPGEKQCTFCTAKATCPSLRDAVALTVGASEPASPDEFLSDIQPASPGGYEACDWVAAALSKVDLIEGWCRAVRAEAERRLLAGETVPGFKLVKGKRGPRQWGDPAAVEKYLSETARLPDRVVYDLKLKSPTSLERLAKEGTIGPRQWKKLADYITQSDGSIHVAPEADPRPAIDTCPVVEDFTTEAGDLA